MVLLKTRGLKRLEFSRDLFYICSSLEDRRENVLDGFLEGPKLRGAAGTHLLTL